MPLFILTGQPLQFPFLFRVLQLQNQALKTLLYYLRGYLLRAYIQ